MWESASLHGWSTPDDWNNLVSFHHNCHCLKMFWLSSLVYFLLWASYYTILIGCLKKQKNNVSYWSWTSSKFTDHHEPMHCLELWLTNVRQVIVSSFFLCCLIVMYNNVWRLLKRSFSSNKYNTLYNWQQNHDQPQQPISPSYFWEELFWLTISQA